MLKKLAWNCQGISSPLSINYLRDIWESNKIDILFLSETKKNVMEYFMSHFGFDNLIIVEPRETSGVLALFFPDNLNVCLNYKD